MAPSNWGDKDTMLRAFVTLALGTLMGLHPLFAAAGEPIAPVQVVALPGTPKGTFTWVGQGSSRTVSIADIEALPMVRVVTQTPWEEGVFQFEGVLLSDFLEWTGAADAASITVRGQDGYSAEIPRSDWTKWPLILATRQDGKPLEVRSRGPARIIYPIDQFPDLDADEYAHRAVWLIVEISG